MATNMKVISGKKKGSLLYIHDDYVYCKDHRCDSIFRCNTRRTTRCRGALSVENDNIQIMETHNHPNSPFIMLQLQMKEEMLKLSRETCTDLKEIFDSVCRNNPSAGQYLSFSSIRCSMHRERVKVRPSVPETLASLRDIVENSDVIKNIYQGSVISDNDKVAIILSTTDLLEGLASATEIYVDGTFSILPRTPHIAQLYSVHIRYMDTGIATLFILCDVRTTTFYDALWNKIKLLVPQLEQNVEFIMSDYEMAAIKSLSNKFPKAKLSGCWFHFNQAVLRKWRKLNLSHAPQTILSMTMALPLLPADMFDKALLIIQAEADLLSREHPNILQFMSYLRLTWSNMASKISTYDCPIRTNNIVESFHNIATQKLGTRNINVWTFLEKLKNLIADQELDLQRLKNGIQPRRARARANRERNTKIINAQKSLLEKRIPLKQFLLFNTRNNIFQIEQLASFDDEALSCDIEVADGTFFADDFNVPIQIERTNVRRRSQRRNIISLPRPRETDKSSEANTDKNSEPELNDSNVTTSAQEMVPTGLQNKTLQNKTSETVSSSYIMENELSYVQDEELSCDVQVADRTFIADDFNVLIQTDKDSEHKFNDGNVTAFTQETVPTRENEISEAVSNIPTSENDLMQEVASIYEVPDDDYGYWYSDDSNVSEELPFHTVNWNFQNSQNVSREKPSEDICTLCFTNERTHIFVPCGHLACCTECIERLKRNRCPVCNTIYEKYLRVRKP